MKKNSGAPMGIYHKDCIDGTSAAAVLLKKFPAIRLVPFKHSYTEKDLADISKQCTKNTTIYIVDFSLRDNKHIELLLKKAGKIITIDHHIGVNERLEQHAKQEKRFEYTFDNDQSGASLTWIYFYGKPLPKALIYVADGDLGRWHFKEKTWQLTSYLSLFLNNPAHMKKLVFGNAEALARIRKHGKTISEYTDTVVKRVVHDIKALKIRIGKHIVNAYNPPEFLRTQIAREIYTKTKKPVAIFNINGPRVRVHFRSKDSITPGALELAQTLGGNGHRNAAAANVSLKQFIKMIV